MFAVRNRHQAPILRKFMQTITTVGRSLDHECYVSPRASKLDNTDQTALSWVVSLENVPNGILGGFCSVTSGTLSPERTWNAKIVKLITCHTHLLHDCRGLNRLNYPFTIFERTCRRFYTHTLHYTLYVLPVLMVAGQQRAGQYVRTPMIYPFASQVFMPHLRLLYALV